MSDEITLDAAVKILRLMRDNAPPGEISIQAILFGIEFHDALESLSLRNISSRVGVGPDTCSVEMRYG